MSDPRLRLQIARRAALLMYAREEREYYTAKRKAARAVGIDPRDGARDLPSNREIRDELQVIAAMMEGSQRQKHLADMRIDALRLMRRLDAFHPRLIGSVLTGHVREGSDIDLHVFSHSASAITAVLDEHGLHYSVERKRVVKHNEERVFTHIHVPDRFTFELTMYSPQQVNYPFKNSITGKTIERVDAPGLEALIRSEHPDVDIEEAIARADDFLDPTELFRLLLLPLAEVKQDPRWHPEGDALYHSLQVFELAYRERPWDEELLQAALLHDVGKAIDPSDHVGAGMAALEGTITQRTAFLIEHHMEAHEARAGSLGQRALRRLQASEDYEDLLLLSELDKAGRVPGAMVCELDAALQCLAELAEENAG